MQNCNLFQKYDGSRNLTWRIRMNAVNAPEHVRDIEAKLPHELWG